MQHCLLKEYPSVPFLFFQKNVLRAFVISGIHQLVSEQFRERGLLNHENLCLEIHGMDRRITQLMINSLVESGQYTLEGIARYTHIPFEVVYDAACGVGGGICATSWTRIVHLYLGVYPDLARRLVDKFLEMQQKNEGWLFALLAGS